MKPKAVETILLKVGDEEYILPNFDFEFTSFADDTTLTLDTILDDAQVGDTLAVVLTVTDDPTLESADDWISLGYFHLRLNFNNWRMTNHNPPTFIGKLQNIDVTKSGGCR